MSLKYFHYSASRASIQGRAEVSQEVLIEKMKPISRWWSTLLRWLAGALIIVLIFFAGCGWVKGWGPALVKRVMPLPEHISLHEISLAEYIASLVELAAIVLIVIGVLEAIYTTFIASIRTMIISHFMPSRDFPTLFKREDIAGSLTNWLLLGLEFEIAADIIRTAVSPGWDAIGPLAAIVAIRAFLNYMLERDGEKAAGSKQKGGQPGGEEAAVTIKRAA